MLVVKSFLPVSKKNLQVGRYNQEIITLQINDNSIHSFEDIDLSIDEAKKLQQFLNQTLQEIDNEKNATY